ncbi:LysE family translocator [Sulfurisphaera ohwakuensis]|uniref:LysE family translocator n=1 Tax=Sulfurisphaera ohwakuensis TaxID=69656 RepID=A0A650CDE7_SULOH|nr:LysE family transporter [Sulfurisphaera ohwakuensis]MBB5253295.1 threonine/homoserine/homoserine lactone efflux protein [Sulfurisphaera ohwakuensis]QGR15804.1 LysE family translocator [Sulfurisphaera ohwakuensis]
MNIFYAFGLGIVMGLSIAAPPGPINAMMAHESIRSSLHGTAVGAGAMTADFIFFWLTYFFKSIIPSSALIFFYFIGGAYMLYLAYGVLKIKGFKATIKGSYVKGLTTAIVNPYQISWWLTFGISMLQQFSVFIAPGFFTGIVIWIFSFPMIINKIGEKYVIGVKIFSFIVLLAFGIYILYQGIYALKI